VKVCESSGVVLGSFKMAGSIVGGFGIPELISLENVLFSLLIC